MPRCCWFSPLPPRRNSPGVGSRGQPFLLQEGLEGFVRKMDSCPFPWCSPQSGLALTHVEGVPKQHSASGFRGAASWELQAWEMGWLLRAE